MERKEAGKYFSVGLLIIGVLAVAYVLNVGITGFAVSEAQSNFTSGTYENTSLENGTITLSSGNLSGTYTSEVFQHNESVNWYNMTFNGTALDSITTSVTNESGWINSTGYSLANFSSSWSGLALTSLYDVASNSSMNLSSATLNSSTGVVTNATNTTYNNVLLSYGYSTPINTSLSFEARASNDSNFTNSSFEAVSDLSNLSLQGQYFQYRVVFETSDSSISPSLSSVALAYGTEETQEEPTGDQTQEETTEETQEEPTETESELAPAVPQLTFGAIEELSVNPNKTGESSVSVGTNLQANDCRIEGRGDRASWISSPEEQRTISAGSSQNFDFSVSVPEGTPEGTYTIELLLRCSNTGGLKDLTFEVVEEKIGFELLDAQRTREDRVRVIYELSELTGENQDVEISFAISDETGLEVADTSENVSIDANDTDEFRTNIEINESLNGTMTLSVSYNSEIYSSSVAEPITLGAPVGGFAIFGEDGIGTGGTIFVIVVLGLGLVFLAVRRMRKSGTTLKDLIKNSGKK